jgi:hypothetical protein
MKHIKTFENYVAINEATQWFPGETIDDFINDGSSEWNKFWKGAKKGDTFRSIPDGVELPYCKKSDVSKTSINVDLVMVGHDYSAKDGEEGALCTIIDRKNVNLVGDDYDESEKFDTIFYTIEGDRDKVYLMPEM